MPKWQKAKEPSFIRITSDIRAQLRSRRFSDSQFGDSQFCLEVWSRQTI